jgi:hypothetical protein
MPALTISGVDTNIGISIYGRGTGAVSLGNSGSPMSEAGVAFNNAYSYATPITGGTVTYSGGKTLVVIDPGGTLATLTVTLPACSATNDGQTASFSTSAALTALTVNAAAGTVKAAPSSAVAGQTAAFICHAGNTTWYPAVGAL